MNAIRARINASRRAILIQDDFFNLRDKSFDLLDTSFAVANIVVTVMIKLINIDLGIKAPMREWFHISATDAKRGTFPSPFKAI